MLRSKAIAFFAFPLTSSTSTLNSISSIQPRRRWNSTSANPSVQDEFTLTRLKDADEGVCVLSLNRPQVKNALGKNLMSQFRNAIGDIRFDSSARVVILRSLVPEVFCAGADLKERATMDQRDVATFVHGLRTAFTDLESLSVPTIAVIDGLALGGGLELALACDMRVAGSTARMGLTETGLAIIPGAGGTQRLPRLVGSARAKELIFTGEIIDANKALSYGLVQFVADEGKSYDKALEIARKILEKGPVAIRAAKMAIDYGMRVDLATGLTIEQSAYAQVIPTKDRLEGLAAFKEKRKPKYKGE